MTGNEERERAEDMRDRPATSLRGVGMQRQARPDSRPPLDAPPMAKATSASLGLAAAAPSAPGRAASPPPARADPGAAGAAAGAFAGRARRSEGGRASIWSSMSNTRSQTALFEGSAARAASASSSAPRRSPKARRAWPGGEARGGVNRRRRGGHSGAHGGGQWEKRIAADGPAAIGTEAERPSVASVGAGRPLRACARR